MQMLMPAHPVTQTKQDAADVVIFSRCLL